MSKIGSLTAIARIAAQIGNAGQARAVLGATADTIQKAYAVLPSVSSVEGIRANFSDRLDRVNATAQGLYQVFAAYTPDLFDQEISDQHALQIGWTISTANELFDDINAQSGVTYFDFQTIVTQALQSAGTWAGQGIDAIVKPVVAGGAAFLAGTWEYLAIAGAVLAIYWFRAPILRALGKARPA